MFAVPRLGLGRAVPSSVAASSAAPVRLQRLSGALLQRGRSAEFQSFKFQQRTADLGSVRHHQHRRGINTWTRTPKHHFRQKSHLPSRLFFPTMSSDPNGSRSFTSEPETSSPSLIPESVSKSLTDLSRLSRSHPPSPSSTSSSFFFFFSFFLFPLSFSPSHLFFSFVSPSPSPQACHDRWIPADRGCAEGFPGCPRDLPVSERSQGGPQG